MRAPALACRELTGLQALPCPHTARMYAFEEHARKPMCAPLHVARYTCQRLIDMSVCNTHSPTTCQLDRGLFGWLVKDDQGHVIRDFMRVSIQSRGKAWVCHDLLHAPHFMRRCHGCAVRETDVSPELGSGAGSGEKGTHVVHAVRCRGAVVHACGSVWGGGVGELGGGVMLWGKPA
jgi:hypothetical protein